MFYSCLTSIFLTQELLIFLNHIFGFFINTMWIGLWTCLSKNRPIPSLPLGKILNLYAKMNNNIQCFPDGSRKVYAKSHEKTVEFYLENTFNLGKDYFSSTAFTSWVPELHYENRQHQSVLPEKLPWLFCQTFAIRTKITGKNFENVSQNSNKIDQVYLKRTFN